MQRSDKATCYFSELQYVGVGGRGKIEGEKFKFMR